MCNVLAEHKFQHITGDLFVCVRQLNCTDFVQRLSFVIVLMKMVANVCKLQIFLNVPAADRNISNENCKVVTEVRTFLVDFKRQYTNASAEKGLRELFPDCTGKVVQGLAIGCPWDLSGSLIKYYCH